jgi:hypothetical protein
MNCTPANGVPEVRVAGKQTEYLGCIPPLTRRRVTHVTACEYSNPRLASADGVHANEDPAPPRARTHPLPVRALLHDL